MIYDKVENFKKYSLGKAWVEVFTFLQTLNEDSEEKRYDLSNGMFAIIMSYPTKIQENAVLESHQKYVDIQMTIKGAEGIEWFYRDDLDVSEKYSNERDVAFYKYPSSPPAFTSNFCGYFTALWPEDAHMPQIKINGISEVKKVVVKVPIDLL
jgi:biofilm protein TabA